MRVWNICLRAVLGAAFLFALANKSLAQQVINFSGLEWEVSARDAVIEQHQGRSALRLGQGRITTNGVNFADGVIRFEASFTDQQSFIGAAWRVQDSENFEEMYLRAHKSNDLDALQYTPVHNGLSAWQMYYDQYAIASVQHKYGQWNQVKIVVEGDSAEIFYNGESAPALHIPDLDRERAAGEINLRVSGRGAKPVYIANFSITPLTERDRIETRPAASLEPPAGLVTTWMVSEPIPESVAETQRLEPEDFANLAWQPLESDKNGFANLAKRGPSSLENNTVLIRYTITALEQELRDMVFGYSDRVRIFLNGRRIFSGTGGWKVRNFSDMGLVSLHDTVGLDLKSGENELVVAVSETFGGWAWGAALGDPAVSRQ